MDRKNISKWIFASVAKNFKHLPNLFIKGQLRETDKTKNWYELKVDGPYIHKLSKNYWRLDVEIDLQSYVKQDKSYLYTYQELQGDALVFFTETIPIYKLGDKSSDDGSFIFCLQLNHDDKHSLDMTTFGFAEKNEKIDITDIEGHYFAKIKNF